MAQVVQRAAGAAELLPAGDGPGLGSEGVEGQALLAEGGGGRRLQVHVGAVQAAVHLSELVVHVADLEVAPHGVVLALAELHVELAVGGCGLGDRAVVTEGRIVIVGIDAAEQGVRRLVEEVREDVLERAFPGIGAGREPPLVAELAVHVEGQPAVGRRVVVVGGVVAGELVHGTVGGVVRQRQVRHAHVEPVARLELEVPEIRLAVALLIEDGDLDRVCALGEDLLGDEVAAGVHRHRPAGHVHRVALGHVAALHPHRAAREADVVHGQRVVAVAGEQALLGEQALGHERIQAPQRRLIGGRRLLACHRRGRLTLLGEVVHEIPLEVGDLDVRQHPQRLRHGLVEVAIGAVGPEHVLELAHGTGERLDVRAPLGDPVRAHLDHIVGSGQRRCVRFEHADLGAIDEVAVVVVHPEPDGVADAAVRFPHADHVGARRHRQPRARGQVVEAEADVGPLHGHVRAALHVRRAAVGIVDGLTVHRDAHQVERKGMLGLELPRQRRDVETLVVVQHGKLVVDHLDGHVRALTLDEAGVDRIVRVQIAPALELGAGHGPVRARQRGIGRDRFHGPASARGRQPDVVAVDRGGAPVQALVLGVADEPQPGVLPARHVRQRPLEHGRVAGRDDRPTAVELERLDGAPGRLVDPGDERRTRLRRAQLRLVRQVLQRIVVPELHLDPAVERPATGRCVARDRPGRALAVTRDRGGVEAEAVLDGERHPPGGGLRQRIMGTVDALGRAGERHIVGEADELDHHVLLVGQVLQRARYLQRELRGHVDGARLVAQRRHQVQHPGALLVALHVAQLADRLDAADLHPLELIGHHPLLERHRILELVVPDLHLDPAVERPAGRGGVRGDRLRVPRPLVDDGIRCQAERALEVLGHLAGPGLGQARVVAIDLLKPRRERSVVRMAHQVQAHVVTVTHLVEHGAQLGDGVGRDVRHSGLEVDGLDHVGELDRIGRDGLHFHQPDLVAAERLEPLRLERPALHRLLARQMPLGGLVDRRLADVGRSPVLRAARPGCTHPGQREP